MKKSKLKRLLALFLCMLMLIPSQGMTALAEAAGAVEGTEEIEETERISETLPLETIEETEDETERISETLPLELIEGAEDETARIKETLALETIKKNTSDAGIIYWNPGGVLPAELATPSNAQAAAADAQMATASNARVTTASNAKKGNDNADGKTPSTPVKTLAKALERAEELMAEEGLLPADITIYAMNPMEVADGQLYALNGGNLSIKSWPGRSYDSDVVFYVNGGQLVMMNVWLSSGNPEREADETRLIYVRGGAFQMGRNVNLEGRAVLDYRSEMEKAVWETATASNANATATETATTSNALDSGDKEDADTEGFGTGGSKSGSAFDMNEYILDNDEDSMELIEDRVSASTWRDPIIELIEGFDGSGGEYLLELLADGSAEEIELVKTLYSDAETTEDFLAFFTLVEGEDTSWRLQVETQAMAQVRNTSFFSTMSAAVILTSKTLVAARAGGKTIYWNPGGTIETGTGTYFAGDDVSHDGTLDVYPVKTWERAVALAAGGTVVCIQTLDLGNSSAENYLPKDTDGNYVLKSTSKETMVALGLWSANPQPAIRVPAGKTLVLQDVELAGVNDASGQTITCDEGNIIINENVASDGGYIQITAFPEMEANPVKVTSMDTGVITLFFTGINDIYEYCYTDVVVPHGALADSITAAGDAGSAERAAQADLVGKALLTCFQLHSTNKGKEDGGSSQFAWRLRQDGYEDDGIVKSENLELYSGYHFNAIYLDGVRGSDDYYGATCQYPVQTWARLQERWAYELQKSVDARREAAADGKSEEYIEEYYPLLKTIYICGTVTVADSQVWDLWAQYKSLPSAYLDGEGNPIDYDGSALTVEVVPHTDIPYQAGSTTLNHQIPTTLVKVTTGGVLKIKDITFRNMTDNAASITIQVESTGSLTLTGKTLLTGQRLLQGSVDAKEVTLGTHVMVLSGGIFDMDADWEGAIEKRQHGVNASGSGTKVTMNGGSIRENNSFEQTIYSAGQTTHKAGAGVVLSSQAAFTMNGGKITGNTVYQSGAGVYMTGTGTSFVMNKGEISGNKMNSANTSGSSSTPVSGMGIGIYAGTETKLTLGNGVNSASDVSVKNNIGYRTSGVGIWSDGELNINQATVSGNYTNAVTSSYLCYGIGIYVGANAVLTMDGGQITGNYSSRYSSYGHAQGVGVYFASSTVQRSHTITGSTISGNKVGYEYSASASYSAGGGIYMNARTLSITDSVISDNQAFAGGGIYISASQTDAAVTIKDTVIQENKGAGVRTTTSGNGGGIYLAGSGSLILQEGVKIIENTAASGGGGLYITGTSSTNLRLIMENETSGGIQINENTSSSGHGGGIYNNYGSISARNVEINKNKVTGSIYGGGGIYNAYGSISVQSVEINENSSANSGGGIYTNYGSIIARNVAINKNSATGGGGGGIAHGSGSISARNVEINENSATGGGGGISVGSAAYGYYKDVEISKNEATHGAGIYLSGGNYYMRDSAIKGNIASDFGGGIYLSNSSLAVLHLTETTSGKFELTGNHAEGSGGGVYLYGSSNLTMNIAGPIQNSANTQGSNFYASSYSAFYILDGKFKQPEEEDQREGVYNFYIAETSSGTYPKVFDMSTVEVESKSGSNPDAIYLHTLYSYLTYLAAPPNNDFGKFPIDLNSAVFESGNIVAKVMATDASAVVKVTVLEPNDDLNGTDEVIKDYGSGYVDASTNVEYFHGGKLPRRTLLGGFEDSANADFTNMLLVGEGIYLSGEGNDSNSGTSPSQAVKTFSVAKTRMAENIERTKDGEGFTPFIYICGQVNIESDDSNEDRTWELYYKDDLFVTTNQNYKLTEGDNAYPAQVRRFAPFVKEPMINVAAGSAGSPATFETGAIIIDGMADVVITSDQGDKSPVIRSWENTKITLNQKTQITNNYYIGLEIHGDLILTGAKDESGEFNKQLYNHQGTFVRLYASSALRMEGYARILADSATAIGSLTTIPRYGVQILGADVSVSMSGNSSIEQGTGSSLLRGGGIYNGASSNANTSIKMSNNASIMTTGTYMAYGVYLLGTSSAMEMRNSARIMIMPSGTGELRGIYAGAYTGRVTMWDNAEIALAGTSVYGITAAGSYTAVTMQDEAMITLSAVTDSQGIAVTGSYSNVTMRNKSAIKNIGSVNASYRGIHMTGYNPVVEMFNNTMISGSDSSTAAKLGYGISVATANVNSIAKVSMNMDEGGNQEDSATIINVGSGNYISSTGSYSLSMGKKAQISDSTYGIELQSGNVQISMEGASRICSNDSYGVYFAKTITTPINILMKGSAAIEQNGASGIYEIQTTTSGSRGVTKFALEMEGDSRISGNNGYGISLYGYEPFAEATATGYHTITLRGNAVIGGDSTYDSGNAASGNRYSGIYASSPIQLKMDGAARISGNGASDGNSSTTANGVYLTRMNSSTYYRSGTARITLNDEASISNNRGGVYVTTITATAYPNTCEIELNGIQDDGGLSSPSIQGNTDSIYLGTHGTLRLKGAAILGTTTNYSDMRSLDCYGYLELDGRSSIEGPVYLRDGTRPITMTYAASGAEQKYKLYLVSGFLGEIVVKPDDDTVWDLTAPISQLPYFKQVEGSSLASREIIADSPNLVLRGDNAVYLSGGGNDSNNGASRSTAVRTFQRARELLKGGGYFTSGANIIICSSAVSVQTGDDDWSFDDGGYVTNTKSEARWKPLVIRDIYFSGIMVSIPSWFTVTFKDITIDGGAEQGIDLTANVNNNQLLYIYSEGTAILDEGVVLQNNKTSTNGYVDCYGYLQLDGRSSIEGIIYLRNGNRPITMTHAVSASDPAEKYQLYLAEGFLGQAVVTPGGDAEWDLTAPDSQLPYFYKVGADGMAADKDIVAAAPDLVLQGENTVYLSGSGSDSYNGNSKSTPVRTFKRAKELLEGGANGGYYTSGANIIICTSTVTVLYNADMDWSFDTGGYVTNAKSGERWKPLVIRDEAFDGIMVNISSSYSLYPVTFKDITIDGGAEQGIDLTASANASNQMLYVGVNGTAILGEGAVLQNNKTATNGYLDCYGYLELDGRSSIEGLIYLRDGSRPITMTYAASGPAEKYKLHLAEGFLGKIVVKPGGDDTWDLTTPDKQLPYFSKVSADGTAADKNIIEAAPNLVLHGEHVYLSGSGNDSNDGTTKSTAVKTFKRAKELLEGRVENGGYFTSGSNIIICTAVVPVSTGDGDWSFDAGGYVTNAKSKDRWKPLVIRDEAFTGVLISVSNGSGFANPVTFSNITIDGGSEKGTTLTFTSSTATTAGQLMNVNAGASVVLKDGAVLQNNKASSTSASVGYSAANTLGVLVSGGTLEIDGGTIQNMVRERTGSSSASTQYCLSSAIYCTGTASASGKVIMKSGQITGNQILGEYLTSTGNSCGAIYLYSVYASMEMSGGQITDNTVTLRAAAAAGAIVNYQGAFTMSGGTIRDNQGGSGSAIYDYGNSTDGKLIFSGGKISGNKINVRGYSYASEGAYSPIYCAGYGMQLKGGAADLQDPIYLASAYGIIKVTGQIYQANRLYCVYLKEGIGYFRKGYVVVQPDGVYVTDVTPYLSYFDVRSNLYVLDRGRIEQAAGVGLSSIVAGVKENQCLILMRAVYLDSVSGDDENDGLTPAKAVKTFAQAKANGVYTDGGTTDSNNHYIIYVSGKAVNTADETWSLPKFAYMCRYTGFAVYADSSGAATAEANLAYHGPLIVPEADLTLEDISIYGRRANDTIESNGDSLVHINSEMEVCVRSGAILADNYNIGSYIGEDGVENITSKGGAFHVAAGGTLQMDGGVIRNTEAADGSAIYLGASEADTSDSGRGRLILSGTTDGVPEISGKVYLGGTGTVTAAYIEPDESYKPSSALQITVANDYNGRPVIQYPENAAPGAAELKYYLFDDAIKAMYDVVNRAWVGNIFELNMRDVIYLDGRSGNDLNDGLTPQTAYKTLEQVYKSIGIDESKYGIVVFVVDTVEVSATGGGSANIELMNILVTEGNGNNHYEGYYWDKSSGTKINIWGQVYFKRYVQPKGYTSSDSVYTGFAASTLMETLFDVETGGTLTLKGICMDGHSQDADNSKPTVVADGVAAMSPLVTVRGGGKLYCLLADGVSAGVSTTTLFTNNINGHNKKDDVGRRPLGELNDSEIMEGSSAGIELLDDGECHLEYTEFSSLQLGMNVIAGGTDVYSNGDLHVSQQTYFGGTVYLEGLGTVNNGQQDTSRYISVEAYGNPVRASFQVLMRDPYMGRTVVCYPESSEGALLTDIGFYRLEERVKDHFCLNKRSSAKHIFELEVPAAVYIDGINGDDGTNLTDSLGRVAGSTPRNPVKSLKRAFDLLKTRGGNTIYVVGTIQVSADSEVTGMSYVGTEGTVLLESTTKVRITRYVQPEFAEADSQAAIDTGYDVADYTGVLLTVRNGASAGFGSGVYFDGHSESKTNTDAGEYGEKAVVSREDIEAKAPLITVESDSTLTLSEGTTLLDNNNAYADGESAGQNGGAIANSGTVNVNGALFENNKAAKGSVVYQNGTFFNIQSKPENLSNLSKSSDYKEPGANMFYLTTVNSGTAAAPVWGTDHVIRTAVAIPDDIKADFAFDVDMDHAVKGRPVVRFTDSLAYSPNTGVDAEHEHFELGSSVSPELFLVESETDPELLELQNWELLAVEVPASIYLAMSGNGTNDADARLWGIKADAPVGDLLTAAEYTIVNKGAYDAKVSISGFKNQTEAAGINTALHPLMNLTATKALATGQTDLYLAVKGLDTPDAGGSGFDMAETSLQPYEEDPENTALAVLGTLTSGNSGNFTFIGAVGPGFMNQYLDPGFPIEGSTGAEAQAYMDGTSSTGKINARAKYLLRYKVEIDPSRR